MKTAKIIVCACLIAATVSLSGCRDRHKSAALGEELYRPRYAQNFRVRATDGSSTVIEILNPWQGAESITKRIFVARNGESAPEGFEGVTVAAAPERVVCFSSSHVAFIDALGLADRIVGVSAGDYITNANVAERFRRGEVRDVGYDTNVNYELLVALRPSAVFIYGTSGENTTVTSKLDELGIPTVYVAEYVEENPLGKSEWIRFMGEIFDRRDQAAEIFDRIAERYENIRISALQYTSRPTVMFNAPYRDVWFAPSDDSYMVRLVGDAGGDYICRGTAGNRSRPLSAESAYLFASRADVWLNPNSARTLAQLKAENPKFADIGAVRTGRVYNCTARQTASGGSDFWESGALRADLVLADMFAILHPENSITKGGYYFEQLK